MIRIGIAGWDYADWNGPVYPVGRGTGRLDRLAYASRYVDLIEINSTFYRPVSPRVATSWVRRIRERPRFTFTAKAHRSWTHEPEEEPQVEATLDGLAPLLDAGRLGALLIQFPQAFHDTPASRDRLGALLERVEAWPVAVEVRHASWGGAEAERWLAGHGAALCAVDQPLAGPSTLGLIPRVTASIAYLRLHGRNVAAWFKPGAGRDARYDYLYGPSELEALAATARDMGEHAEQLFVVQNNHFRGQALVNALQLRHLIEDRHPEAPACLVDAYPELAPQVTVHRDRLF